MAEALQQSSSPEIHGGQRSELVDEASNHDRNHAQILEALAAVTQLFEEGHALATKQNVDLHAENMNQRAKAARQDAELHAQLLRNNEATAAQRAELHAQQLHMNKAAAAQQAELHAQRLQINEAAAAEQAKLHAQQLQINDSAAVQLANLDQIFQKHSERAEQCFSAYAAHHDDSLAVRIWVQKESVASNTGVLVRFPHLVHSAPILNSHLSQSPCAARTQLLRSALCPGTSPGFTDGVLQLHTWRFSSSLDCPCRRCSYAPTGDAKTRDATIPCSSFNSAFLSSLSSMRSRFSPKTMLATSQGAPTIRGRGSRHTCFPGVPRWRLSV